MSGDGSQPKGGQRNALRVTSKSKILIYQIRQILIDNNIWATICKPKSQDAHTICVSAEFIERFIGISKFRPVERKFHKRHIVETDEGFWSPVKALRLVSYKGVVCNLEVEGEHTYQVEGVAVHNSGFLGWIAREQYHPTPCQTHPSKNVLLTKDELEMGGMQPQRGQMPEWVKSPEVTGMGALMTTGNDHLRKLELYSKQKAKHNRLQFM